MTYRCTFEIEVEADSAEEAAGMALEDATYGAIVTTDAAGESAAEWNVRLLCDDMPRFRAVVEPVQHE
jgi:hypothetical protein